jgi:hypothetical protein
LTGTGTIPAYGAPEQIEERRTVEHHHDQPPAGRDAEPEQRIAAPRDPLGQRRVGDVFGGGAYGDSAAAAFTQVAVDEGRRDVETGCEGDAAADRTRLDRDAMILHPVLLSAGRDAAATLAWESVQNGA